MSQKSLPCSALLLLGGLLVSACGPSESALSVRVLDWPAEATGLRVLTQFGDQAKPAFFVEPGVSDFAVYVPTEQPGRLVLDAMVQDAAGCDIAGQLTHVEFSAGPAIQRIELALRPYESKHCPVGSFSRLEKVWMDRTDNAWTVGDAGSVLRWNGKAWLSTLAGHSEFVTSLWPSPTGEVWVVGTAGLILRWDGSRWNQYPGGVSVALTEVWGSGEDDLWAVGSQGTVLRYAGRTWDPVLIPTLPNRTGATLLDVWGSRRDDVWVVGVPTAIFHFDGTTWSAPYPVTLPPRRDSMPWVPRNINTVYGNPAGEVFIVDSGGGGNILRFSDGGWVVELAEGPNLYGLWAPSSETVWAIGDHYLYRRSGTSWASDPGFNGVGVGWRDVSGTDRFHAIAVGYVITPSVAGIIRYWNGIAWSDTPNF